MFEGERDKKKKVYPLLPDGNKRVHLYLNYINLCKFPINGYHQPTKHFR